MNNRPTISWVHLFIAIPLLCVVFSFYLGFYYKNSVFVGPFIMKDPILVKEPLGMEDWEWKPFCERMIKSGFAEESWPGALRLKVDPEFIEQQILKIMGNNAGQFPALKKAYNVSELVYFQLPGQTDWPKDVLLNFIPESPSAVFVWSVPHSITANESMSSILNRKVATSWLDPLRWGSLVEFEHVVRTEKKHPRYIRNQWELFHFKMYAGFVSLMTFPLYVSLAGLAAAFLLIYFWKSPFLFLAWWWVNLNYLLVHKVLYWPYLYTGGNLDRFFSGGAGEWSRWAIKLGPGSWEAWKNLGVSLEHQNQIEEAFLAYFKAVFLSRGRVVPVMHLTRLSQRYPGVVPDVGGLRPKIYREYCIIF